MKIALIYGAVGIALLLTVLIQNFLQKRRTKDPLVESFLDSLKDRRNLAYKIQEDILLPTLAGLALVVAPEARALLGRAATLREGEATSRGVGLGRLALHLEGVIGAVVVDGAGQQRSIRLSRRRIVVRGIVVRVHGVIVELADVIGTPARRLAARNAEARRIRRQPDPEELSAHVHVRAERQKLRVLRQCPGHADLALRERS